MQDISNIRTLICVALQIPARCVSGAGKQRVDAGLRLRWIEDELGFAAFLLHRVVACDRDLSEGLVVRRQAVAKHSVVDGVGNGRHAQSRGERDEYQALQEMLDSGSQDGSHVQLYLRGRRGVVGALSLLLNLPPDKAPARPSILYARLNSPDQRIVTISTPS
jgi:hypothetical protein